MAVIIDGKAVSAAVRAEVAAEVEQLKAKGITPGLAVIIVGDDPAFFLLLTYTREAGSSPTITTARPGVI